MIVADAEAMTTETLTKGEKIPQHTDTDANLYTYKQNMIHFIHNTAMIQSWK